MDASVRQQEILQQTAEEQELAAFRAASEQQNKRKPGMKLPVASDKKDKPVQSKMVKKMLVVKKKDAGKAPDGAYSKDQTKSAEGQEVPDEPALKKVKTDAAEEEPAGLLGLATYGSDSDDES